MSEEMYLPYHRRFRPKRFIDYVGNEKVKNSVMAALRSGKRPQVLLFQGHAGCGKTSMARLIAKEYLCENRDDVYGACGECYYCKRVEEYIESGDTNYLSNVKEIDVTESNKKQNIDELLDDASLPSFDGTWKIYILDECHMLSNAAQNRLLKTLEEPVEKVLMILCTTDPEKLLPTIISRCQYIFKVTKPTRDELVELLIRVCKAEGVEYDTRALSLVCVKGDFVPRKTLIALEQVVREKQRVTYENVLEVLNIVADKYFYDFYELLLSNPIDTYKYIAFLGNLKTSIDLKQFVDGLLQFTLRGIYVAHGVNVEALDKSEVITYKKIFSRFTPGDLAYLLDLLMNMKSSMDVEAKLILLGFTGLRRNSITTNMNSGSLPSTIDIRQASVAEEKLEGSENYLKSITMSESEKENLIENNNQALTVDLLTQMFQGTLVNPNE